MSLSADLLCNDTDLFGRFWGFDDMGQGKEGYGLTITILGDVLPPPPPPPPSPPLISGPMAVDLCSYFMNNAVPYIARRNFSK